MRRIEPENITNMEKLARDLCPVTGLKKAGMISRVRKYKSGKINWDQLVRKITIRQRTNRLKIRVARITGLSLNAAYVRVRKFKQGEITKQQLFQEQNLQRSSDFIVRGGKKLMASDVAEIANITRSEALRRLRKLSDGVISEDDVLRPNTKKIRKAANVEVETGKYSRRALMFKESLDFTGVSYG